MANTAKTRILLFDTDAQVRATVTALCDQRCNMEVVGAFPSLEVFLKNPANARALAALRPDVVVAELARLEQVWPEQVAWLKKLLPGAQVIAFSDVLLTKRQVRALGIFDAVPRPCGQARTPEGEGYRQLLYQIRNARLAGSVASAGFAGTWVNFPVRGQPLHSPVKIVALGASAGGTAAISQVVTSLPENVPGVLVVQHMPKDFTAIFAKNLNKKSHIPVREARDGDVVLPGTVYIAPGDRHMTLCKRGAVYGLRCGAGEKVSGHRPSVDVLFDSVAATAGPAAVGVILTGMGGDGAAGLLHMREAGAYTIGQDQATCVVYGMPEVAHSLGAVCVQRPIQEIAGEITRALYIKAAT